MQAYTSAARRRLWTLTRRSAPALAVAPPPPPVQHLGGVDVPPSNSSLWPRSFSSYTTGFLPFGPVYGSLETSHNDVQQWGNFSTFPNALKARYSTMPDQENGSPTDTVQDLYQKMLKSVEARTMPPNAWLWSLISNCSNREDIKLLFQILQKLRIFRLSNLRIHSNFNCHLCMRVSEACARAGALDYGTKALWKHNIYGLTPSIGSVHYLLSYAKEHSDAKLMVNIMDLLQKNSLPLQPGTADIVFSICYNKDKWDLINKYAKKFMKAGVKLHRTAFDIWMEFAAKVGDAESIWKIEKLRAKSAKQQTLASGFSCAKGYLLEHNPETAAATIHLLHQNLPDSKKSKIPEELQKLISEWPLQVVKRQKKEDKEALSESLKRDIPAMVSSLLNLGLDVSVDLEELEKQEVKQKYA